MATTLRPDSKGRITLGKLAIGISGFSVEVDMKNRIILEPLVEIPASERWIYADTEALKSVTKGIAQAQKGKLKKRGPFFSKPTKE